MKLHHHKPKRFRFQSKDFSSYLRAAAEVALADVCEKQMIAMTGEGIACFPNKVPITIKRKTYRRLSVPECDIDSVADTLIDKGYGYVKNDSHNFG